MTTQKLTLPIQVGKKYVRRDGKVITVQTGYTDKTSACVFVGTGKVHYDDSGEDHAWTDSGLIYSENRNHPHDLIANFVQKSQKKPRTSAAKPVAQETKTYTLEQCLKAIDQATGYTLQGYSAIIQKQLDKLTDPEYIEYLRLKDKFEQ